MISYRNVLVLLVASLLIGYWTGSRQVRTQVVEHTTQVEAAVRTEVVYRDRIVEHTVTKYSDGTTVTKDQTRQENTVEKATETASLSATLTSLTARNYSLGLRDHVSYERLLPSSLEDLRTGLEITAGRRLLGDIWMDVGWMPYTKDISLGLRVEF